MSCVAVMIYTDVANNRWAPLYQWVTMFTEDSLEAAKAAFDRIEIDGRNVVDKKLEVRW
jgi:hypothetical protein